MRNKLYKHFVPALLVFVSFLSCTKLDENDVLYDKVTGDKFGTNDLEVSSMIGAAYSGLKSIGTNAAYVSFAEVTSDEIVVPTRGVDWGDGGQWVRLKRHTWTPETQEIRGGWTFCYGGIGTCNRLIATFEDINTPSTLAYIPDLKVLRAFYYYLLLDWYGNVPLSTDFKDTEPPASATQAEVYAFVEKELLENSKLLPRTGPGDVTTYGRVNFYTGYAILSKLYLNAGIYTGQPQWDKAIAACDTILNNPAYHLSTNYRDNFVKENSKSPEFIWALPFDAAKFDGFNLPLMTLNPQNQKTYNISEQPWNGFSTAAEYYTSYIDSARNPGPQGSVVGTSPTGAMTRGTMDKRLSNFLVGPQYDATGNRLVDGSADADDPDGNPLTFTPYMNELEPNAWRQSGARIGKWEFYNGMTRNLSNDFAIFRVADIILGKAEAIARKNNNWNDPVTVALVTQIRQQHGGVDAFVTITADNFLDERGREMYFEGFRRQDMIRFDKFNNAFQFHEKDPSSHVNLFPIPQVQRDANAKLNQNPGYQ